MNQTQTQIEAYLKTDKVTDRGVILELFKADVTAQLNDLDVQHILFKYGRKKSLRTITARLNDLQHRQEIKISKIENGKQYYSLRLKGDPLNKFDLSWKDKYEILERLIKTHRYGHFNKGSLVRTVEHIKAK